MRYSGRALALDYSIPFRALAVVALAGALGAARVSAEARVEKTPDYDFDTYEVKLVADEDAFVGAAAPDANHGGDSRLYVGQHGSYGATRTLLRFGYDDLEREEVVLEGELRLYVREGGPSGDPGRDVVVRRVKSGWDEGGVTWNSFPDVSDERLDAVNVGTGSGWQSWEIDKAVRRWYYEEWDNHGLYVQGYEAEGSYRAFDSSEGGSEPELELTVAIDDLPPVATLDALPEFLNTPLIVLTWEEGEDPDPASGIDYYEVWYRVDQGRWTLAEEEIEEQRFEFRDARSGHRYAFKIIAVDRAGNRQVDGPAQTATVVDLEGPIASVDPLPAWVNGTFNVTWQGEDLPRPPLLASGIQHFDAQLSIAGGGWGTLVLATTATSHAVEPAHGQSYRFRVRAVDFARNPGEFDAGQVGTQADMIPPETWMTPASGVDTPQFVVGWGGTDHGLSGIASYDVEYRVGTGLWQQLASNTASTSTTFNGTYGVEYAFRSRARDNAGNVGGFPTAPQRYVTVIESAKLTNSVVFPLVGTYSTRY